MSIILAPLIGVFIGLPLLLKLEERLNRNDDVATVNEFNKFKKAMEEKK